MEYQVELVELAGQPAAIVRGVMSMADIGPFIGEAFGRVLRVVAEQGLSVTGPPFGRFNPGPDGFGVEAGFPVDRPPVAQDGVDALELPAGVAVQVMHRGSYETVRDAYTALQDWQGEHGYQPTAPPWECYLDGPEVPEPRTVVISPCRLGAD